MNTSYISKEDQNPTTKVTETVSPFVQSLIRPKKKVDLRATPNQNEDTPKTKRRYLYEKTGNYVSYARAKQLGLVK